MEIDKLGQTFLPFWQYKQYIYDKQFKSNATEMQAVMMSSNECSKLKSFQRISFYDQDHLDLCKKGHFWCQYPNGSSIFEGEAAFEDVNGLCRKKNGNNDGAFRISYKISVSSAKSS